MAEILACQPVHRGDPDLVVAEGAAIQAAMIDGAAAVQEMVVTDVASHSLGVEVIRAVGSQRLGGYFTPVIHRNTVIPTTQSETFSTIDDDQRSVALRIYEGDGRRVADNRKIGELEVNGIPRGRAPKHFIVRFTYDQNGMLEVQAEIQETKAQVSAVFRREGGEVTGAELERARARLQAICADPMDRPRYRDLYARAKLLWSELDPVRRAPLDRLLDVFDAALARRDTMELERSFQALLAACEAIDHGERW